MFKWTVCLMKYKPLYHTAAGGCWSSYVSIWSAITLTEVRTAHIVNGGRREVLRWIFWPSKLLLGFTINLDWIKHGDTSRIYRCSNFEWTGSRKCILRYLLTVQNTTITNIYMLTINSIKSTINHWNILNIGLTKDRQLLVSLQSFLSGERKVKPPCPCQVDLHGATKDLHIRRCSLNSLTSHLHPHARHDHWTVVVHCFHSKSSRLEKTEVSVNSLKRYGA